jgi:hypothetical protein
MTIKRLIAVGLSVIGTFALTSPVAQAGAPRWYGKETGALVPFGGRSGLVEITSPETLRGVGQLKLATTKTSACLVKSRESVQNPPDPSLPGVGKMKEFELICEEGTGAGNYAAPYPCIIGEAFEVKGIGLPWASTLEVGEYRHAGAAESQNYSIRNQPRYYDKLPDTRFELHCLNSQERDEYGGALTAEVEVGRLILRGTESGELVDSSEHRFSLSGTDFFSSARFKDVRVNSVYHEIAAADPLVQQLGSNPTEAPESP